MNTRRRLRRFALVAALLVSACSPSSSEEQAPGPVRMLGKWRPLFQGIEHVELRATQPRPMRGHALRVDLQAPGIEFLATPSNGDRPAETDGLKTSSFLAKHKCQAAINAAPFSPVVNAEGAAHDIEGLQVSRGEKVSEPTQYPALLITKDNKAAVASPPFELERAWNAVAGFGLVLKAGQVLGSDKPFHPRTAAGVSRDGRYLYLLVIDGRQQGFSEGASTAEVGEWLKLLGAWDGLNLDGGGTTTMATEGADGKPRVLNRPIHAGIPGTERPSASHLGIRAKPLKPKEQP
ncbi:MAG: phosphodiester glycosidase family protein [Planctomycetes bacterium]|nr:phosphodiester glycosidase family protein [Planctomycetota bacterium]